MKSTIATLIQGGARGMRPFFLAGVSAVLITFGAAAGAEDAHDHTKHEFNSRSKLVQVVRDATRRFADVNAAVQAGYKPLFGCVSGPDHGAMGIHYIDTALVGDGKIDASRPEAIIYEPTKDGMQMVGVEYIVDAATWSSQNTAPPMLEGQAFQLVGSPNRYGLPPFFELHVWAWRQNPNGAFVDWNNRVSCEEK